MGEESYGEKAGAALVSCWETRMLLFNSILQTLLSTHDNEGSYTYTPTGDSEEVGMEKKELEGNAGRKKRWQEPWLLLSIKNQNKIAT